MDRALRAFPMEITMRVNGGVDCRMGMGGTSGRMGTIILGIGEMGVCMGMEQ
jgi:hypothetical protein